MSSGTKRKAKVVLDDDDDDDDVLVVSDSEEDFDSEEEEKSKKKKPAAKKARSESAAAPKPKAAPKKKAAADDGDGAEAKPKKKAAPKGKADPTSVKTADTGGSMERNGKIADVLMQYAQQELARGGDHAAYKFAAYKKASTNVAQATFAIQSGAQAAKCIDGVGKGVGEKIDEIIKTGTLEALDTASDPRLAAILEFQKIPGITNVKAAELYDSHGINTLDDLRSQAEALLKPEQCIALRYLEEFSGSVPRDEVQKMEEIIRLVAGASGDGRTRVEIVGAYRRGVKEVAGKDGVEVLVTHPDHLARDPADVPSKAPKSRVLESLIQGLRDNGLLTETLTQGPVQCTAALYLPAAGKGPAAGASSSSSSSSAKEEEAGEGGMGAEGAISGSSSSSCSSATSIAVAVKPPAASSAAADEDDDEDLFGDVAIPDVASLDAAAQSKATGAKARFVGDEDMARLKAAKIAQAESASSASGGGASSSSSGAVGGAGDASGAATGGGGSSSGHSSMGVLSGPQHRRFSFRLIPANSFACVLLAATGAPTFVVRVQKQAADAGYLLTDYALRPKAKVAVAAVKAATMSGAKGTAGMFGGGKKAAGGAGASSSSGSSSAASGGGGGSSIEEIGTPVPLDTEEDIFATIGAAYVEPALRHG